MKGGMSAIALVDRESFSQFVSDERIMGSSLSIGGFWKISFISVASDAFFWFVCCFGQQTLPILR